MDVFRDAVESKLTVGTEHNHALDDILELTDIAGPVVIGQGLQGLFIKRLQFFSVCASIKFNKVMDQRRDIFPALFERWN